MIGRIGGAWLAALALAVPASVQLPAAQAGWSVGVSVRAPVFVGPCYRPHYYYRPYPVYVGPAVYVEPAPVYAVPAVVPAPAPAPVLPAPGAVVARSRDAAVAGDTARYQQQLQNPEPRERAEALVQLGRLRAPGSLESLRAALNNDRSPLVRESAARALGLFGSADALDSLQRAAQADEDREVRRSASYAADVIRTNLQRR